MNWIQYDKELKGMYLWNHELTSFSWEGAPQGLQYIDLMYNQLTSFSWEKVPQGLEKIWLNWNKINSFSWTGAPQGLKAIRLSGNNLSFFSWEGAPQGLESINLCGNQLTSLDFKGCPINLTHCYGFKDEFIDYLKSKQCRLDRSKYTRPIADMITHANLVSPEELDASKYPVLQKYASRDYYKLIEDFKNFTKTI